MNLQKKFSEEDLQRIKNAVKQAERNISGEIVPVISERSGDYYSAIYKSGIISALIFFALVIVFDRYVITDATSTIFYDPVFIFFVVVLGGVVGALICSFFDPVRRLMTSRSEMDSVTRQNAENAFLEEEIFNTRHRTGIMIFVSFFEHEVIVMADRGISKVVDQNEWDKVVADLIGRIRQGNFIEGLEAGIKRCGEILLEKGFKKTDDDVNELRDDLRLS